MVKTTKNQFFSALVLVLTTIAERVSDIFYPNEQLEGESNCECSCAQAVNAVEVNSEPVAEVPKKRSPRKPKQNAVETVEPVTSITTVLETEQPVEQPVEQPAEQPVEQSTDVNLLESVAEPELSTKELKAEIMKIAKQLVVVPAKKVELFNILKRLGIKSVSGATDEQLPALYDAVRKVQ